ncbi:MAG TPA: DUF3604 domain-containing protein [Thermoanaerobaculia bacterium]|nr:DUF3604 domain-containing protein [Thermoanaerobaculia bacterium]
MIVPLAVAAMAAALVRPVFAQEEPPDEKNLPAPATRADYSPYAGHDYPTRVLWGDTHLHTSVSVDAGAFGCTLGPEEAYRFARGEEVTTSTGQRAKISRPLDFLVVSDHAEMFGLMPQLVKGDPDILATDYGKQWYEGVRAGGDAAFKTAFAIIATLTDPKPPIDSPQALRNAWQHNNAVAEKYNEPGRFTAFIGFEWTSMPNGNNLHRVVVFRDGADRADRTLPYSQYDSPNPEDLWKYMANYEKDTGGQMLAIPHNGNVSGGLMWADVEFTGKPMTKEYALARSRWEPVIEVTQQKGDSETHPFLSPDDEFADFGRWDKVNLNGIIAHNDKMFPYEYAREALKRGLRFEEKLGANPFKFGMIGSTDSHVGISAVEEDNYFGKVPTYEPNPHRWDHVAVNYKPDPKLNVIGWEMLASGYAGVWARENTREAIFDALKRKEAYATTGSRMTVRFFGGWNFAAEDAKSRQPAAIGYEKGIPMGGDLRRAPSGKAPTFLAAALKDPLGGNLDRIQIVKGWMDAGDELHEKVYDVAWSGDRKPDARTGKLPPVGNTVDVPNATWTNTIGAPELIAVWRDPNFDPKQRAFYYARVLEIPTPRWTAYDAKRFGIKPAPGTRMTVTERAYTSPIWYAPN